jgi:hypothetical protein
MGYRTYIGEISKQYYNKIKNLSKDQLYELRNIQKDENGDQVTNSWKYEYSLFELVRIYKQFNGKENILVYYGY